ncbi:MAG TPA: sialate O-acetylesterase, partial [Chitinophagaceae bacterium]|nr:sialate O-acetylesterase [Chitinophagaceae bacterium]
GWSAKAITTNADAQGKWQLYIKTANAGGPYTITIKGNNTVEVNDVLLGEVWLCSGQSNMGFTLKSSEGGKEEIAAADLPTIRYFSVKRQYGLENFDDCPGSVWQKTKPANAGNYSAVAFYFAKKIQQELKVPVGIIFNAWGGTPAEAWTPMPVLKGDTILSKYIDRWAVIQNNVGKDSTAYNNKLEEWKKDSVKNKKPSEPQTLYYFKRPWREPSVLFNGMTDPVIPYGIKGVLWYQGESNVAYADEYFLLFSKMIESWRNRYKEKGYKETLPFYFVQIAPNGYNDLDAAARLREAQQQVADKIPNTAMAVTMDVGDMNDIHYTRKKEVGDRLALLALKNLYKQSKLIATAPTVKKKSAQGGLVTMEFTGDLDITKTPGAFEIGYRPISTDSIVYVKANTRIESNKIIAWTEKTRSPLVVRYGWLFPGEANVMSKEGLPVAPFRLTIKK